MEVETLQLFVDVALRGSFAAVARDRDAEPSSVSRVIGLLEKELGFRLFQRTTRRMSLTEAGAAYLQRISPLVEQIDAARDDGLAMSAGPAGTLRLTASVAFGATQIVPLLPEFRAAYPKVAVELLFSDANLDLVAERIDLAVRLAPSLREDLVATKLTDTHYRVCAAPAYLRDQGRPQAPSNLSQRRCLLFALPEYRTRWLFRDASGRIETVPVAGDVVVSNALALRETALLGLGPALLPNWLTDSDVARGALVDLFPSFQVAATDFTTAAWLLYPSRVHLPAKVRAAIDFLRGKFSAGRTNPSAQYASNDTERALKRP